MKPRLLLPHHKSKSLLMYVNEIVFWKGSIIVLAGYTVDLRVGGVVELIETLCKQKCIQYWQRFLQQTSSQKWRPSPFRVPMITLRSGLNCCLCNVSTYYIQSAKHECDEVQSRKIRRKKTKASKNKKFLPRVFCDWIR